MKRLFRFITALIAATLLISCNSSISAYHRANTAFEMGQYKVSFANYLFAAKHHYTPAQYAVGYQYFYGLGTRPNEVKAIRWFQRADSFSVRATYALSEIENFAPRVPWAAGLKRSKHRKHHSHKHHT